MRKKTSLLLITIAVIAGLIYLGNTTDDKTAENVVKTLSTLQEADNLYVLAEEKQYIDDEIINTINIDAYWDEDMSAMWFKEQGTDGEPTMSFISKHGTDTAKTYGDFDFISNYTDDFALNFSAMQLVSYMSLIQSPEFDIVPSNGGFTLSCNNEKLVLSSNEYIYDEIDEENGSIADLLGENIKASLNISIKRNYYGGVTIVGTTKISGDQHYITLIKSTDFRVSQSALAKAKKIISEDETKYSV